MKEAYKTSLRQEYNVSVAGTTGNAQIFASFGYLNNKGIIDGEDMQRYTARIRTDYQAKEWFKIGMNAGYTNFTWNNGNGDASGNIFSYATSVAPIYLYMSEMLTVVSRSIQTVWRCMTSEMV